MGQNGNISQRINKIFTVLTLLNYVHTSITFISHLMLTQQEGKKHQHASVVDNPPHVYVTFSEALSI